MEEKVNMDINTKAVHVGDRRKPGAYVPVTTPIYTAATFLYDNVETLDKVFAHEQEGYAYARYDSPNNSGLEELCSAFENGHGALACASGMAALQLALSATLIDRRKHVLAASALYGASINLLMNVMAPFGVEISFVDITDLTALEEAILENKPGCILMETISNPLLRVGDIAKIAAMARANNAALIVDNTFASPMIVRPLDLGAHIVVHSLTKYLSGHGDSMGGVIISDAEHFEVIRSLSRTYGPILGPFESYLCFRGMKTFPLRMERHCANAIKVARYLEKHPAVERVHFPDQQDHPDKETIASQFAPSLYGGIVTFLVKSAAKQDIMNFMDRLKLVVRGTSLGDVHSLMLYPLIASHRDLSPKQRQRQGIHDNLVRLSVGIESASDICTDLDQALR